MPNLDGPEELDSYLHLEPELAEVDFLDVGDASAAFVSEGVRLFSHGLGFEAVAVGNETVEDTWKGMIEDGAQVIQTDYPELLVPVLMEHNQQVAASAGS